MNLKRLLIVVLILAALGTALALNAWTQGEPRADDPTAPETSAAASPTEMTSAEAAEAFCSELSYLLTSVTMLELGFVTAVVDHGPGRTADMAPDASAPTWAENIGVDGLRTMSLAPVGIRSELLTLSEAGTAMMEALADDASLADLIEIWDAPEVQEAKDAVRAHDESTCT